MKLISDAEVGYVKDMEMWKLGNMVYLAVATTYKMPMSKVGEGLALGTCTFHNLYFINRGADFLITVSIDLLPVKPALMPAILFQL